MANSLGRRAPRFVFLSEAAAGDTGHCFGWRLDAANNRPLGRGIHAHPSLAMCRAAADRIHRELTAASPGSLDLSRGHWTWRLLVDGAPVAVCGRPYLRRIECRRGLEQFLAAAAAADPADGVVRHFGLRSLYAYDTHPIPAIEPMSS